jgi:hypothetical protein
MRLRRIWKFHLIIDMVKVLKDIMALADFGEGGGLAHSLNHGNVACNFSKTENASA